VPWWQVLLLHHVWRRRERRPLLVVHLCEQLRRQHARLARLHEGRRARWHHVA
jgi:hypothetical protein